MALQGNWKKERLSDGSWEWNLYWRGASRATVFSNGVWHTHDKNGTGGENSKEQYLSDALMKAYFSALAQGFLD